MNILINKILTGMKIADDKKAILFQTDSGDIPVSVDGDCCSDTWIESIELPALGFPCLVSNAEDLLMPNIEKELVSGNVIKFYGFKISTDKGDIVIDYRNESNGYYGGNLYFPKAEDDTESWDYCYGGVFGQNISKMNWVEIK